MVVKSKQMIQMVFVPLTHLSLLACHCISAVSKKTSKGRPSTLSLLQLTTEFCWQCTKVKINKICNTTAIVIWLLECLVTSTKSLLYTWGAIMRHKWLLSHSGRRTWRPMKAKRTCFQYFPPAAQPANTLYLRMLCSFVVSSMCVV